MIRHFRPRSTPSENLRIILHRIPWKLLLLLPVLIAVAIPTFIYGSRLGAKVLPGVTNFFYTLGGSGSSATPTPFPPFPAVLPQPGSILYTVQAGDNCDEILTYQMRMADAGQVFSDVNPDTVKALDNAIGQDCHNLQPGMVLRLSPHYPLVALGGIVLKAEASSPQQVLPTPIIHITPQQQLGVDCSNGCLLTVRIAPKVQAHLLVQTTIPVPVGAWVWAQATLARKTIKNFDNYPYVDSTTSLNGMELRACDLQINDTHDDNSLSCDQLLPNTIQDDGGAWLFGVTGPGSLDHWHYNLHLPAGTRVLIWLSADSGGNLKFRKGNAVYRYDVGSGVYVRV